MIWVGGKIVPDDALTISVLDRTFEHGLGLFETLRTWDGQAPLLDRHLARMKRSAEALGLPLDGVVLPNDQSVAALLQAQHVRDDVILRITLSGGFSTDGGATLWMRTAPMPDLSRRAGTIVGFGPWQVDFSDQLARHKTLNYWSRRHAFESARRFGLDEVLSMTRDGRVWEGSRSNLFIVRGSDLWTPSQHGPIVPGVMRELVLKLASDLSWEIHVNDPLTRADLVGAEEVFLTNSVRGVIPVLRVGRFRVQSPGEWTRRVSLLVTDWLKAQARDMGT
jgi:branched-chain amino acid aminotransferase